MPQTPKATRTVYIENNYSIENHMSEKDGWAYLKESQDGRKMFTMVTYNDGSVSFRDRDSGKYLNVDYNNVGKDWLNYVDGLQDDCLFLVTPTTGNNVYIRAFLYEEKNWFPEVSGGVGDMYVRAHTIQTPWSLIDVT